MSRVKPEKWLNKRFGRLFVTGIYQKPAPRPSQPERKDTVAVCICDCGNDSELRADTLTRSHKPTRSCGCIAREVTSQRSLKHGLDGEPLYHNWVAMRFRCYNPKSEKYHRYGGRGIKICDEWLDPTNFVTWILENLGRPPEGHTLDRINNDGNYEPSNVRWADAYQQTHNRG